MRTRWGIEVAGEQVIYQQGAFTRRRYWLKGWHRAFQAYAEYIQGLSGPETVVTVEEIRPVVGDQGLIVGDSEHRCGLHGGHRGE